MAHTSHAGHGGVDPGAIGNGHQEADIARLYNDEYCKLTGAFNATDNAARSVNENLSNIVNNVNRNSGEADWNLSWHLNAASPAATGAEVFYFGNDQTARQKAAAISAKLAQIYGIPDRGAKDGSGLYVIRNTKGHMLLIELGFISNANDVNKILSKRSEAVRAVASIMGYNVGGSNQTSPSNPSGSIKQLTRYWVGWNVGKDFKKIQEYRVNMNKALKIDYADIHYYQDGSGDWHIGVTNLDRTGSQNWRLRLMKAYGLNASQMEGFSFNVDSYLWGYKDISLAQLQNLRVRWTNRLGVDPNRLVQRQSNGNYSLFISGLDMREVQHWNVGDNVRNADMKISDKRYYEKEKA